MIALSSVGAALLEENLQLLSERVRGVGSSYKGSVTSKKTCVELALETHNRILKGEESDGIANISHQALNGREM